MLQIVKVLVITPNQEEREVRALIDSGASSSWIKKGLADEMELPTVAQAPRIVQSLSSSQELELKRTEVTLRSRDSQKSLLFRPWVFPGQGWRLYQPTQPRLSGEISRFASFEVYDRSHL